MGPLTVSGPSRVRPYMVDSFFSVVVHLVYDSDHTDTCGAEPVVLKKLFLLGDTVAKDNLAILPTVRPSDYHIPASNKDSRSTVLKVRVDIKYVAAIRLLVQNHRDVHGWVFDSDFLRWAIHFGMEEMNHRVKLSSFSGSIAALRLLASAEQARQEHQNFENAVERAVTEVGYLRGQGHRSRAQSLVADLYKRTLDDPDPYWRKRWATTLQTRFGDLLPDGAGRALHKELTDADDD